MVDESGEDSKVISVPKDGMQSESKVLDINQIEPEILDKLEHFFTCYKDLEKNKNTCVKRWGCAEEAKAYISAACTRFTIQNN